MIRNIDAKFKKPYNNCNLRKIIYHQYLPMFMSIFNLRGAQIDRFRYEVFQNLFLSPMNTGFPRDTVATVLTVYGIETSIRSRISYNSEELVATVLTVYGIETHKTVSPFTLSTLVATVLTVYGIETTCWRTKCCEIDGLQQYLPFTVLKLQRILLLRLLIRCNSTYRLRY